MKLKRFVKKIIPEDLILFYHRIISILAGFFYGFPSRKMVVIGVTGTKGKTTTATFIWSCLNEAGIKTGLVSSAQIALGKKAKINDLHMTMPGRFVLKGLLCKMVKKGCQVCVLETTSEGIKQGRHIGVSYDVAVFTNLSPEHLLSHGGSFEKYKKAKGKMFSALKEYPSKKLEGKKVPKTIIANKDDGISEYFLSFWAEKKVTFGLGEEADFKASIVSSDKDGVVFSVNSDVYKLCVVGEFNVKNALPSVALGSIFDISREEIRKGLEKVKVIPGRMERIEEGQDFSVLIDYAHEEKSMEKAVETAQKLSGKGKVIVLLGAEGGGRDKRKRPAMGRVVGSRADYVVVSNVDPYFDDPREILEDIAQSAERQGKTRGKDLFVITNRQKGIRKSLLLAKPGDVVLITGKGAEQSISIKGEVFDWDDREVTKKELRKII